MGEQKKRMLAGELYIADDPELGADNQRAMALMERFNASPAAAGAVRHALLHDLLGSIGEGSEIRPPMYCDYGQDITIGHGTFISFGAMLLDVAPITIGNDCQIGPNVQFLTPTHPLDPEPRREKWEAARPIAIGDNTVVGAGAVVTRDLPANVLAIGNPARVVREL